MGVGSVTLTSQELRGVVAGDTTALLAGLDSARDQSNNIVISCRFLVRVDFSAAGTILNWVVSRQAEGCMVQFQDVHRLVAAFFNVIGISEHARVVPRDL
jgi:ABC-type transporter Mla MlaB component